MNKIKVAIVGVGNCASSLIQGYSFYRHYKKTSDTIPGILHESIGGYEIKDIEFVAAFDVDKNKVGKDLSDAIFSSPNCVKKISKVSKLNVQVQKGPVLDGVCKSLFNVIKMDKSARDVDVASTLIDSEAEILINFLPTGSKEATNFYASQAIKAKCCFINAIPEAIATRKVWCNKFKKNGLLLVGDDLKSQIGSTILHRSLIELLLSRGVLIDQNYQVNLGGNNDFLNLSDQNRVKSKIISKKHAVEALIPYPSNILMADPIYMPGQNDTKVCHFSIKGKNFGLLPVSIDVKLSVEDSPNAGAIIVDVIRAMRLAKDRGLSGRIDEICAYYFKYNLNEKFDSQNYQNLKQFFGDKND